MNWPKLFSLKFKSFSPEFGFSDSSIWSNCSQPPRRPLDRCIWPFRHLNGWFMHCLSETYQLNSRSLDPQRIESESLQCSCLIIFFCFETSNETNGNSSHFIYSAFEKDRRRTLGFSTVCFLNFLAKCPRKANFVWDWLQQKFFLEICKLFSLASNQSFIREILAVIGKLVSMPQIVWLCLKD